MLLTGIFIPVYAVFAWLRCADRGGISAVSSKGMLVVAVALLLGAFVPQAVGATEMTLEDCIRKALELNPNILDAAEVIYQAENGITEARSGFLPQLNFRGSYNFLEQAQTVSLPDPATGGEVEMELDFTRDYSFQFLLSQPVYTGGRVSSSYKIAKYSEEISHADLERRQADAALDVSIAFYALILAREAVTVTQQAIDNAEEFLRITKARYKTGEASSFEVMRAEVEVSNLKPLLIRSLQGIDLSELAIKKAMGVRQDEEIDFVGAFEYTTFDITLEDALQSAFEHRPELRMADVQASIADESIKFAKSGRLPTLSVDFNYDVRMDNLTVDSDKIEDTYAGYLTLGLPLFDGLRTKSQIAQTRSQRKQADIYKANLEDLIELEVRGVALEVQAALETLRSQEKNVEMAEEGLEIANERYLQGYATNLEVLDAQLALNTARKNRLQAIHDLNVAAARAKKAMGTLLKDY
jgi:outer membrane protein